MQNADDSTTGTPPVPDETPGPWPRRVGVYRLMRPIGEGGMGVVYAAVHEGLGRPVAIKFIRRAPDSVEMRRRFMQEREVLSTLRHPAIATIYDAGEIDRDDSSPVGGGGVDPGATTPYIVMEYVVGAMPITRYCGETSPPLRRVLELFESLFDALEHAHRRGIVHRDIKPGNILVDSDGRPRIIDFGLSLPTGTRDLFDSLNAEGGRPAGTPGYMSPEQRLGDPLALDHRTDIYSMALVMREVVRGMDAPSAPPAVLDQIERIIESATAASAADRPRSAAEVRDALREAGERLIAGSTLTHDLSGPVRRGRGGVVACALASAALGLLLYPLLTDHTPLGAWYTAAAAAAVTPDDGGGFQHVRVITITEETLASPLVAGEGGPLDAVMLRTRHADVLDRLVDGGARAVVWDLWFRDTTAADESFAAGIRRAISRGVPVVLMEGWWSESPGEGSVSPTLAGAASMVAPGTGTFLGDRPWTVDIAARLGDGFLLPALPLVGASLAGTPEVSLDLEASVSGQSVRVRRWRSRGAGGREVVGDRLEFPVSFWTRAGEDGQGVGLTSGDEIARLYVSVPNEGELSESSLTYEELLGCDKATLIRAVSGRVVVLGRIDEAGRDLFAHPGGRRVAGVYAHAAAIERLVGRSALQLMPDAGMYALCAAGGAWGAVVGAGAGSRVKRLMKAMLWAGLGLFLSVAVVAMGRIVYPAPVVGSIVCGAFAGVLASGPGAVRGGRLFRYKG